MLGLASGLFAQTSAPPQPAELVIDQIKQSVVFLETSWTETGSQQAAGQDAVAQVPKTEIGTGFVIWIGSLDLTDHRGLGYLVTAKHMIRQVLPSGQPGPYARKVVVRFNTKSPVDSSGRRWDTYTSTIVDDRGDLTWFVDEEDPIADVALTPFNLNPDTVDYKTIGMDMLATKEFVNNEHVNENDEVLFTGLFTSYFGATKNYPIVRHGKLALIPHEQLPTEQAYPTKKTDVYLAEVTSFGGNSGSPVFLRLGGISESFPQNLRSYHYYLLGLMKGFFPDLEVKQNSGIALVVPTDKILETLSSPACKAYVAREVASDEAQHGRRVDADTRYREAIAILEKSRPNGSQLMETLLQYAEFLRRDQTTQRQALDAESRARKLQERHVETPQP